MVWEDLEITTNKSEKRIVTAINIPILDQNLMISTVQDLTEKRKLESDPSMILGDPTEIHQIVINLCTNAAHAMKTSGGILEVNISDVKLNEKDASRYEDLSSGDFVKLTVRDSGEGISPDVLEKVFEAYFTTKEFGQGSGMGW